MNEENKEVTEPVTSETPVVETPAVEAPVDPVVPAEPVVPDVAVSPSPVEPEPAPAVETPTEPAVETPAEPAADAPKPEEPKKEKKKPNLVLIIGAVVALIAIAVGACFALGVFDKKKEEEKPKEEEKTPTPPPADIPDEGDERQNVEVNIDTTPRSGVTASDFNGVYQSGTTVLKIYAVKDDYIVFDIEGDFGGVEGYGAFANDKVEGEIFETYSFVLYNEGVGLETTDTNVTEKTFKKMRSYDMNQYYKDFFGDSQYLDGRYNWEYQGDSCIFMSYQTDDNTVVYQASCPDSMFESSGSFAITGDEAFQVTIFEEVTKFNYDGDKLTITQEGGEAQLAGTYTRTRQLKMEDVIHGVE